MINEIAESNTKELMKEARERGAKMLPGLHRECDTIMLGLCEIVMEMRATRPTTEKTIEAVGKFAEVPASDATPATTAETPSAKAIARSRQSVA